MRVTLVLTHQCNMRCTYCYAGPKFERPMAERVGWKAIEQAFAHDDGEPVTIAFFGGEPMLRFEQMLQLSRLARKLGKRKGRHVIFTVTTNGTVMNERHVRFFRNYGFYVGLSLDGLKEAHDRYRPMMGGQSSFDRIWRGIELAAQWLTRLDVMMVVSPGTVGGLAEAVERLRDVGCARVSLIPNVDDAWDDTAREQARAAYRRVVRTYLDTRQTDRPMFVHPFVELRAAREAGVVAGGDRQSSSCGFGLKEYAVAPSGRLYPCARLVGDDTRPEISLGTVDSGAVAARVDTLRAQATEANAGCGNEGSCLCVPHMPGYAEERGERLHFLQTLCNEVLDEALSPVLVGG